MLEIENDVVVVVFIFLKRNCLCVILADPNDFYIEKSILCSGFQARLMPFACMLHALL